MGLLLRVGVAYGYCAIDPMTNRFLGAPIVYAHQTESIQAWMGAACHPSCLSAPFFTYIVEDLALVAEYSVPVNSTMCLNMAIDWVRHTTLAEFRGDIVQEINSLPQGEPREKWQNTLAFFDFRSSFWNKQRRAWQEHGDGQNTHEDFV